MIPRLTLYLRPKDIRSETHDFQIRKLKCLSDSVLIEARTRLPTVICERKHMAGSEGLWAAVLSNSPTLWPLTFDLWLVCLCACLTSVDIWRLTGVRDEQSSSVSENRAWDNNKQGWNLHLAPRSVRGENRRTATYRIRYERHSLIHYRTGRSCGACRGPCSLTGWWGWSGGWTGSCCCCSGLCQWRTATPPGREYTCWALTWKRGRKSVTAWTRCKVSMYRPKAQAWNRLWNHISGKGT